MSVLGQLDIQDFLRRLDERTLLDVCSDILAIEGHKNIRITDGTGDGQRDIHSVDSKGNNVLVQSKYHAAISHSVPAKELGEIVMGMVRFGYKNGLFITSAKISPQAKRDCLNDYSNQGFSVDFWEGREIVKKIFDNLVLKAIWYDGHSLDKVAYTLIIPIIARDLTTDKPLQVLPEFTQSLNGNKISVGRSEVQINYQRNRASNSMFGAYRSPKRKTPGELGSSNLGVTEAILSGIIHLDDLDLLLEAVNNEALPQIKAINPNCNHFAVIFGTPSLTPLGGKSSGARIKLDDYKPNTIVVHDDFTGNEFDWINPPQNSPEWILPDSPRVTQADWIRWYNPIHDLCLDIYISCPPSDDVKWKFIEQRDYFIKWWEKSLFMLVPNEVVGKWDDYQITQPTKSINWDKSSTLCCWLHPVFDNPIMQLSIEPEYENATPEFLKNDLTEVEQEIEKIKNQLSAYGGSNIHPAKARHMVAIQEGDPYPDFENVIYQCKQIGYYPDQIPTPISPDIRYFQFTICWKIELSPPYSNTSEVVAEMKTIDFGKRKIDFFADSETESKENFIMCEIELTPDNIYQSTEQALGEITPPIIQLFEKIESHLSEKVKFTRATKEYWNKELLIIFKRN